MYNAMLDPLPEDYQGWLIRTDYRIGVQIQLCLSDQDLPEYERIATALSLLYGNGMPDLETAMDGLRWFIDCGQDQQEGDGEGQNVLFFDFDSLRLVSSFKKAFGIDISRERLHWFEFLPMLSDLSDTSMAAAISFRTTKESEVSKDKLAEFRRVKRHLYPPTQYSEEEKAKIDQVLDLCWRAE